MRGKLCKLKQSIVCFCKSARKRESFCKQNDNNDKKKKEHSERDCSLKGPDDSRIGNDVLVKAKGTSELFSCSGEKEGRV